MDVVEGKAVVDEERENHVVFEVKGGGRYSMHIDGVLELMRALEIVGDVREV